VTLLGECLAGWQQNSASQKYFCILTTKASWSAAEAACAEMGAKLASITDQAEMDFVKSIS